MNYAKGVFGMIVSSVLFSVMSVLIRIVSDVDPFKTSMYRFLIGIAILSTLALFGRINLRFNNIRVLVLRGVTGGLAVFLFYLAIARIGLAKGSVISNIYPIFATIGGAVVLKERVTPLAWLFVAACMAGVVMVNHRAEAGMLAVDLWTILAFVGSILAGVAVVAVRRLSLTDSPYSIFFSQCVFGLWIVIVPASSVPFELHLSQGLLLCAIGFVATVAQLLMTWSYRHVDVAAGSLLSMLMVVFNVSAGVVFFREVGSPISFTGMAIVVLSCIGIVAANRRGGIRPPRAGAVPR